MAIADVKEYTHLSTEEVEELGKELDAIRADIEESRGERDARYIRRAIQLQRALAAGGRIALFNSRNKFAWAAGTGMLHDSRYGTAMRKAIDLPSGDHCRSLGASVSRVTCEIDPSASIHLTKICAPAGSPRAMYAMR